MAGKFLRDFEIKSAARGEVVAVFSTFNTIDSDGDVTLPGAFTDGAQIPISAYGHKSWEGMLPVGRAEIRSTRTEAQLHGRFFLDTASGKDTFTTVKELAELGQWSYGYDAVKYSYGDFNGKQVRFLEQLAVHEVSPVLVGAGTGTRTVSAKQAGGGDPAEQVEIERIYLKTIAAENELQMQLHADRVELLKAYRSVAVDYSEDLPRAVPLDSRTAAAAAVATYAPSLGLKAAEIRVKWFSGEHDPEFVEFTSLRPLLGRCQPKADPRVIWLRSDLDEADAWSIAAHELRHLAGGDEDDARVFEEKARFERSSQ